MVYGICVYAQRQQMSSIYLLRRRRYIHMGQLRVIRDEAVIPQTDPSFALIMMANSH